MSDQVYLCDLGMACAIGSTSREVWDSVLSANRTGIAEKEIGGKKFQIGSVAEDIHARPLPKPYDNRVNAILDAVLDEIEETVKKAIARFGSGRIAVLLGSCDNGSETSLNAHEYCRENGTFPEGYTLAAQRADLPSRFAAERFGLTGPVMTFSTACASSASALASGRNMIRSGLCDAVIAGGVDIVSVAVALGFDSLEAVSNVPCQPFSANRKGINLGEGAAVFVMSAERLTDSSLCLLGAGESADAHHMTAPDPEGKGAALAMERALADASLTAADIDYLNLHGTGTALNDAMESLAVRTVFGRGVPVSSTKSLTGHTLGAAGALELGICWLSLSSLNPDCLIPAQRWDGIRDPALPPLDIVDAPRFAERLSVCMSNSFAFGGCDVSLIVGHSAEFRQNNL